MLAEIHASSHKLL